MGGAGLAGTLISRPSFPKPCNNAIMRTFLEKRAQRRSLVTCDRQPRGLPAQPSLALPFAVQNPPLDFWRSRRFCPPHVLKSLPSFRSILGGGEKTNGLLGPISPLVLHISEVWENDGCYRFCSLPWAKQAKGKNFIFNLWVSFFFLSIRNRLLGHFF